MQRRGRGARRAGAYIGVHVCPVRVRNWIAAIHSSVVMLPPRRRRRRRRQRHGSNDEDALCFPHELVHVPRQVLEDEPVAAAVGCVSEGAGRGCGAAAHGLGVSPASLIAFCVMISSVSGSCTAGRMRADAQRGRGGRTHRKRLRRRAVRIGDGLGHLRFFFAGHRGAERATSKTAQAGLK